MAKNGADILVLVNMGTLITPMYQVMGSQRDVTFEETNDEIDVSSKDAREKRVLAGRYSSSISLDALYVPSDSAYQVLKAAMRAGTILQLLREEMGASVEYASAIITSLSEAGPDQGEATVSASFTVDGAWVEIGT